VFLRRIRQTGKNIVEHQAIINETADSFGRVIGTEKKTILELRVLSYQQFQRHRLSKTQFSKAQFCEFFRN